MSLTNKFLGATINSMVYSCYRKAVSGNNKFMQTLESNANGLLQKDVDGEPHATKFQFNID